MAKQNAHWTDKALRAGSGAWWGPAAFAGVSGGLGALAGRYVGAPLAEALWMPGEDEIGAEELEARRKKLRQTMMLVGGLSPLGVAIPWGLQSIADQGLKGLGPAGGLHDEGEKVFSRYPETVTKAGMALLPKKIVKEAFSMYGEPDPENPIPAVPIGSAMHLVAGDPYLSADQKGQFYGFLTSASDGNRRGLLHPSNVIKAGIGAGLGYTGANVAAKVLGSVFGLQPSTKKTLRRMGALAGALLGSGVIG